MTRKPASASGAICWRQPYQNSGKPCSSRSAGPSSGPAATAFKCPQAILNESSLYVLISLQREKLVELRTRHHLLVELRRQIELAVRKPAFAEHRLQLLELFPHGSGDE